MIEVLAVCNHGATQDSGGYTLLAHEVVTVGKPLDIGVHSGLEFDHAWQEMIGLGTIGHASMCLPLCTCTPANRMGERLTIKTESHLGLEHLELLGGASAGLVAHLLASPLEGAVELLGKLGHDGGMCVVVDL